MIDKTNPYYQQYIDIQIRAEDRHQHKPKNKSPDGFIHDYSNILLMNMVKEHMQGQGKVLDIGCNTGYHTEQLKTLFGEAVGTDINPRLIARAKEFGREYCFLADMHDLQNVFDDEEFAAVFAHEVLEHSADFEQVLDGIMHVLKSGGLLVFSMPCEAHWKAQAILDNQLVVYFDDKTEVEDCDSHFLKPTVDYVVYKMRDAGFSPVKLMVHNLQNLRQVVEYKEGAKYPFMPHLFGVMKKC